MTYNPAHVVLHANHAVTLNGDKLGEWGPLNRPHGYFFLCGGCTATIDRFLKSDLREAILIHVAGPRHGGSVLTSPAPKATLAPPPINPDLYARSAAEDVLTRAIERLEYQSEVATSGEWRVVPVGARVDIRTDYGYDARGDAIASAADSDHGALHRPDAELIVTLHRTIDAQLAILRASAGFDYPAVLDLARAILGEE